MFLEITIAIICGLGAGTITGLIPGIHINLVSVILVSISGFFLRIIDPIHLAVFIISMAVTHTFLDSIPSIFLGAPDADMALNVLPGHRMLMKGQGYEAVKLTVIGSLLSLIIIIVLMPLMIQLAPAIYSFLQPYIGWILAVIVVYIILIEHGWSKKIFGLFVFLLSGFLGLIVLNNFILNQPLFALLSGLFGVSTLLISLQNNNIIPAQSFDSSLSVGTKNTVKAISAAVFSGSLTGLFPGLGAAQAAIIGMQLVGKIGMYGFMILIGGINTVNFVFSLVTFYTLEKARNGGIVAVQKIVHTISLSDLIVIIGAVLVVGGVAALLALSISKLFARIIGKFNYRKICYSIIFLITILALFFDGLLGFLVLFTATMVGMLPAFFVVKRSLAMGCLLLPVIIFFLF